jgi:D-lactate dehydrogenase
VIVTAHQGYFTAEALGQISTATLLNVTDFEMGRPLVNEIRSEPGVDDSGGRRAA